MQSKILSYIYRIIGHERYDNSINYAELLELKKNNKNIILLDVRSKQEFQEEHLNGAVNIPSFEIDAKIENMLKDKKSIIIVYCKTGGRSSKALKKLQKLGYENVYNLKNGLDNI